MVVGSLTQHLAGTAWTTFLLAADTSPVRDPGLAMRADAVPAGSQLALSFDLGHAGVSSVAVPQVFTGIGSLCCDRALRADSRRRLCDPRWVARFLGRIMADVCHKHIYDTGMDQLTPRRNGRPFRYTRSCDSRARSNGRQIVGAEGKVVGVAGIEPATSCSQSMCATSALHPDGVRACLGYTARVHSDTEGPTAPESHDNRHWRSLRHRARGETMEKRHHIGAGVGDATGLAPPACRTGRRRSRCASRS